MPDFMPDSETRWRIANWLWDRREQIAEQLQRLYRWFLPGKTVEVTEPPRILIIGAGGVGKTTLGAFLSGQFDLLSRPPGEYIESLGIESHTIEGASEGELSAEVVIPPGQEHRRKDTWEALF